MRRADQAKTFRTVSPAKLFGKPLIDRGVGVRIRNIETPEGDGNSLPHSIQYRGILLEI